MTVSRQTRVVATLWCLAVLLPGTQALSVEPKPAQPEPGIEDPDDATVEEGGAPILVSVSPGARALDPVAIPGVFCRSDGKVCETIVDVITRDLTLSGFFKPLDPVSFIADMDRESLTSTKWEDWFNVGAKYLIKAQVEGAGKGNYTLSFRLYDVAQKKTIEVKYQEAAVGAKNVRMATHRFVNEVIRAITGMPGPFGGRILYAAKTGNDTKGVFAMDVDGYGKSRIATGDTINMLPSSAGGATVYTSFAEGLPNIYVNGQKITRDGRAYRGARMSPGGKVLAVAADDGGQCDIFLMDLEGNIKANLTNHWADDLSPNWSPGGDSIAFVSNRSGGPQIWIMGADGGNPRRLTMAGYYNSTPDWGPGGILVFAGMDEEAHSDIFTVDLAGNINRVTQDQGNNKDPTISPDGRHLAFVSNRDGRNRVYISTIDGRYQFPITEKGGSYSTLFWAR